MALRNIRKQGEEILTKRAKEIHEITPRIRELATDMLETMYDAEGVGLAGPQVGILKRIVVIDISEERNEPMIMINPVITSSDGSQTGWEGCLSVPGKSGQVTRPERVTATFTDIDGNECELEAEGFLARAVCHELDHLDGHLYVEKVEGRLYDNSELQAESGEDGESDESADGTDETTKK
ncbi:MAG: peptide deformylase [Lachnospiraceae bacterium]|nr:peptide deformylase [Lachnospiraceae bacterium]